ncbi:MAG TPA: FAD binding domain-containing protein [Symbiobacteriaceae bacterium]|nr:FAD binding domain-containing protein [Symbiobacteriaceae bacterium]
MPVGLRDYLRPDSLTEAVNLLRQGEGRTALLAGGTELVGRRDQPVDALVDLRRLVPETMTTHGGTVAIGAMTTLHDLFTKLKGSLLARAAALAAPATIRAAATLGGTLAGEKGGLEVPTALLAMGATVILATPTLREVPLGAFLANKAATLQGSIITEIRISTTKPGGLARVSRTPADRAIIIAAAVVDGPAHRVAVGGLAPYPRLADPALDRWEAMNDHLGSAEYRRWVAPVLVRRALEEAQA